MIIKQIDQVNNFKVNHPILVSTMGLILYRECYNSVRCSISEKVKINCYISKKSTCQQNVTKNSICLIYL